MYQIFEKLVKNRIEVKLQRINLLQAGSRKNCGPPENVSLSRSDGPPLYGTAYDFEQAFDSLWLEDCILPLNEIGVEKEYRQLINNLNKTAQVIVLTPYGPTALKTDPVVKQGTVLGPCLCSSYTGEYCNENPRVCVGCIKISVLVHVDDIIILSSSIEDFVLSDQNSNIEN